MATMEEMRKYVRERERYAKTGMIDPELERHAAARHALHSDKASHRPLSEDYELVGLAGEKVFCEWAHIPLDTKLRRHGKKGANYTVAGHKIDVFCARTPEYLLVEPSKAKRDIYVLCGYRERSKTARLVGWASQKDVKAAPVRDVGGMGIRSHAIHHTKLRPMEDLAKLLGITRGGRTLPLWDNL